MRREEELKVLNHIKQLCNSHDACRGCPFCVAEPSIGDRCCLFRNMGRSIPGYWSLDRAFEEPCIKLTPEQAFAEHTRLARLYVDFPDYIQGDHEPVKAIKEDILRRIDELREIEKSALGRPSH